ncbi:MAG: hypothetical protein V4604_08175 [Bacteroidota bacterium]
MNALLACCLFFQSVYCNPVESGIPFQQEHSEPGNPYLSGNKINLEAVRTTCNFLTDNDITEVDGNLIPRRKTAFIRHIKHINETLEQAWVDNRDADAEIMGLLYELRFFEASLKQKAAQQAEGPLNIWQKIRLRRDSNKSSRVFRYKQPTKVSAGLNDPTDSPFWHAADTVPLQDRFDKLAKLKKIKAKKNMVVLFDKLGTDGSAPKIDAFDLDLDNDWTLKWGDEVHTDIAGSRIFAALGYDVDHPYYYGENKLTLVFNEASEIPDASVLVERVLGTYDVDLSPFISEKGIVTTDMADSLEQLRPFIGKPYVRFKKCGLEARPDRVKRIGSFLPEALHNDERTELRGALLAHQFIGNWDTREANTLLTLVHRGNYEYYQSAVFSDLGTSFGVVQHTFPPDFKTGLVNAFPWEAVLVKNKRVRLTSPVNAILDCYSDATYDDLQWMAKKIGAIDSIALRDMVHKAHWPKPLEELYFHKLASRRASILTAFQIPDLHPIAFDRNLNYEENGVKIIENGMLLQDYEPEANPESFLDEHGRFRNYGH